MDTKITDFSLENFSNSVEKEDVSLILKLSHELKTPIHGIRGISTYLNKNWDTLDEETRRKNISNIAIASEKLASLLDAMLNKKHDQKEIIFDLKQTDLVEKTEAIVNLFSDLYINKNNIDIKFEKSVDNFPALIDSFWYDQLLDNLLSNSINYSTEGTIIVGVKTKKINDVDYLIVSVRDEGVGIPESELRAIFSPFNRGSADNAYLEGTGLGLTICQEIVEGHGGKITASNNQDKGSTIKFSIPRAT